MNAIAPRFCFRQARERVGLAPDELAKRCEIPPSCVYDIEAFDDELTSSYSPRDIHKFCRILGISPKELFGVETSAVPITSEGLVRLIHERCRLRGVTLEQFEDTVGWKLTGNMEPPNRLLEQITVDGLQWLCRELGIDWHRVIAGL